MSNSDSLFNEAPDGDYEKTLFEQYKMYVELADRVSQRRMASNSFYLTANAALVTVASWFKDDFGAYIYMISIIGISIALFWFFSIRSYGQLNSGKFKVIHEIESRMPLNLFAYEWSMLVKGKSFKTYWPLSHVERVVPFVFVVLYIMLSIFELICI